MCVFLTHRPWSWVRDSSLIFHPPVVRPLLVGVRPVKGRPDVGHAVDAHRGAAENGASRGKTGRAEAGSEEAEQVERVTARRTANSPRGGEDCVHHGVLVISGAKQEDVLCERKRDLFLILMIGTKKLLGPASTLLCVYYAADVSNRG